MGETLTRAFTIADGAEELESTLAFGVYAKGVSGLSDITVSLKQYKERVGETTAQSARPLCGGPFRRFPFKGEAHENKEEKYLHQHDSCDASALIRLCKWK